MDKQSDEYNIKRKVLNLFPSPVYVTSLEQTLNDDYKKIFNTLGIERNVSNLITTNRHILNDVHFHNIRKNIEKVLKEYTEIIINPKNQIEIFITESWITITGPGQSHHKHNHPNSFLSGVLYLDVLNNEDSISFYRDTQDIFDLEIEKYNDWNSGSWSLKVSNGDIVIFPSKMFHSNPTISTEVQRSPRISLAFNTFIRGTINQLPTTSLTLT